MKKPDIIGVTKPVVFLLALLPALKLATELISAFYFQAPLDLGANPAQTIEHITGDWCINFLMLTLLITPARRLTHWNWLIRYRRMFGLFAFFYGVLHILAYLAFDKVFRFNDIIQDIFQRPYITVGMAALLLMLPLAITSTRGWIRRLGKQWTNLHKLVYVSATLGVVHYWWLVKRDITWPLIYALILFILLGSRFWFHLHKASRKQQ
ncbi:protein-methionine-sulfoxide reductase heme-binding subunit MsrQ [Microvirga sp. W0021]|uniref:Protein-methionine-sulfoxide reductase heme-binding subunit MsrQ n=1 Tax=Hohaiivirga grylli TaxID=3133970 RepID=A0ABV0BLZ3_9HYPH